MIFWNLLQYKGIQIPALQRDYAQGRKDKAALRQKFVGDLLKALKGGAKLHLDFIYGYCQDSAFIPLDGQQRLTTLFLLHSYVGAKEDRLNEANNKAVLKKFSYATRVATREFCEALVEHLNIGEEADLKTHILDQAWFLPHWEQDPSVAAMLRMLQEIHKQYSEKNCPPIWDELLNESSPISFDLLNMKKYKLGEELYIKMNARGKQLSTFELFKNAWYKALGEANFSWPDDEAKKKMDSTWARLLWDGGVDHEFGKELTDEMRNKMDLPFLRFINMFFLLKHLSGLSGTSSEVPPIMKTIDDVEHKHDANLLSLEGLEFTCPKQVLNLFACLTKLEGKSDLLKLLAGQTSSLYPHFEEIKKVEPHLLGGFSYYRLLLFAVLISTLEQDNYDESLLKRNLRIARNFNATGPIEGNNVVNALKRVEQMFGNIQELWKNTNNGYNDIQAKEEARKAALISSDADWQLALHAAEDYDYFRGRVGYLLDYAKENEKENLKKFERVLSYAKALFNDEKKFIGAPYYYMQRLMWVKGKALPRVGKDAIWQFQFSDSEWRSFLRNVNKNEKKGSPYAESSAYSVFESLYEEAIIRDTPDIGSILIKQLADVPEEFKKNGDFSGARFFYLASKGIFELIYNTWGEDFKYIATNENSLLTYKTANRRGLYYEIKTWTLFQLYKTKVGMPSGGRNIGSYWYFEGKKKISDTKFLRPTIVVHFKSSENTAWNAYRLDITNCSHGGLELGFHANINNMGIIPDDLERIVRAKFGGLAVSWEIKKWQPEQNRHYPESLVSIIKLDPVKDGQADFTTLKNLAEAIFQLHQALNLT